MNITKTIMALLVGISMLVISGVPATAQSYTEGNHYVKLQNPIRMKDPNSIEVRLFCAYPSGHCAQIFTKIETWMRSQQDDVKLVMTPVTYNKAVWTLHARAFYTAEALRIGDRFHRKMYGLTTNQMKRITTKGHFESYITGLGIDQQSFHKTWKSFGINSQVKRATALTRTAKVSSIPAIIVDGKYRINSRSADSLDKMLKVADFLIKKAR
ncbi:thiol:disulfide interchange protein DsbA/DsbL [Ahrensia sp. AH-315-G08]|nr:thiol:disulfide interchange protein DsbA/DsbL [Ahrensia sp. AH-315-G08]